MFVFRWRDTKKTIAGWDKEDRRGHEVWLDPDGDHTAIRASGTLLLCTDEWVDPVIDAIESSDAGASSGPLRKAAELSGTKPSILSFLAQDVRLNKEITIEIGYLSWAVTKNGIVLRGGVGGSSDQRKLIGAALRERFDTRRKTFPVLESLKLETKTSDDVLLFSLEIPAETLQAILLQPAIFAL